MMSNSNLNTARNELFACLDTSVEELLPPLTPNTGYVWRELANKVIRLAARFVAALDEAGGGEELKRRKVLLENLTGAPFQRLRKAAYKRLRLAFAQASPDKEIERIPISQLTSLHMPEQFEQQFLVRDDVKRFAGDPEAILWSPYTVWQYWGCLAQLVKYPELVEYSCEVSEVVRQIEAEHLWACFLLAVSREVTVFRMPDRHQNLVAVSRRSDRHRNLVAAIMQWGPVVTAIRNAVDDLSATLPVDDGQARAKGDEHDGGGKAPEEVSPTTEKAAGVPGGSLTQADDFAKAPGKRRSRGANRKDSEGDRKIYEAWKTGHYATFADCGRELGISSEKKRYVELAVGRYRKYLKRHSGKG
jgi:hypothetical protein